MVMLEEPVIVMLPEDMLPVILPVMLAEEESVAAAVDPELAEEPIHTRLEEVLIRTRNMRCLTGHRSRLRRASRVGRAARR